MKVGIIPAGGKATRWDGFPKEMLSTVGQWTLLDRTILMHTRALVDRVVVVSSPEKYDLHKWWLGDRRKWPNVGIAVSRGGRWGVRSN